MVTETQVKTQIQEIVRIFDQVRLAGAVNSGTLSSINIYNWIARENAFLGEMAGDYASDALAGLRAARRTFASTLTQAGAPLSACLRTYGQVLNFTETDVQTIFDRLVKDAYDNNKRVASRGFTFGSFSAGSPMTGNGTVYRLLVNEYGFYAENCHSEAKTLECTNDAISGATGRNAEIFQLRGAALNRDTLAIAGSGDSTFVTALTALDSFAFLRNPSFSQLGGTATVPTDITSWTSSITVNASNYQFITDTYANQGVGYYRDYPGDTTPYALQCLATSWSLSQPIEQNRNTVTRDVPLFAQVAYKKSSVGTDGTLALTLGAVSTSIDLSTISDTNWHVLVLPVGTNNWYRNFGQANLTFTLARSAGTTGNVTIDDVILAPFTQFNGTWWAVVGGTTPFKLRDIGTITDTELGEYYGILQKWFWRALGRFYPAIPAAPTTDCSVALAGAGAGNVDNGAHTYTTTFVDANGVESGFSTASHNSVTVTDKTTNGKVSVTAIPTGPSTTASRKVYRSKAGTSTPFFLLTTVSGNVTTTYTDNTADSSLGAQAATVQVNGVTFADPT